MLNDALETIGGVDFDAETIMCTNVSAETRDNGSTYNVSYEFQYRSDWAVSVVAINPDTGSPWQSDTLSLELSGSGLAADFTKIR